MKGYKCLETLSLNDYLNMITELRNNRKKVSKRKRFWEHLILTGQLTCPATGLVVTYCQLDRHVKANSLHYNFYSECGEFFTIDHKIAKHIGGKDVVSNIQPMEYHANVHKGHQLIHL